MSQTVNIENSIYDFEIILFSEGEKGEIKAVPITKSSIKYLEIEDDLNEFGYKGSITFTNFDGLLQKLGVYNSSQEAPYLLVRIKNLDFAGKGIQEDPEIFFLASLGKSSETGKNVTDKNTTFLFEEYIIAKLKRTIATQEIRENLISTATTPADIIRAILLAGCTKAGMKEGGIDVEIVGTSAGSVNNISEIASVTNNVSFYELVNFAYLYLCFELDEPGDITLKTPGIIKLENLSKSKRGFKIRPLGNDIKKFLKLAKTNPNSSEIKNYLTEKFSIASSSDPIAFGDNFISNYDLLRVDFEDVFENKWVNLQMITGGLNCSINEPINYEQYRYIFEKMFTDPFPCNLPERAKDVTEQNIKTIKYTKPGLEETLARSYGTNKIFKSFVFDNTAMIFKVKGQVYRTPGKFIHIKADSTNSSSTNVQTDEINGFWYVLSVKHIFENDIYKNEIICVKFYKNYGELAKAPTLPVGSGSSSSPNQTLTNNTPLPGVEGQIKSSNQILSLGNSDLEYLYKQITGAERKIPVGEEVSLLPSSPGSSWTDRYIRPWEEAEIVEGSTVNIPKPTLPTRADKPVDMKVNDPKITIK